MSCNSEKERTEKKLGFKDEKSEKNEKRTEEEIH